MEGVAVKIHECEFLARDAAPLVVDAALDPALHAKAVVVVVAAMRFTVLQSRSCSSLNEPLPVAR
jgi:hypothetical protein